MKTGIVRDNRYKNHNMGAMHPESPQRIEAIYQMIDEEIEYSYHKIAPHQAEDKDILRIHTSSYFDTIKSTAGKVGYRVNYTLTLEET